MAILQAIHDVEIIDKDTFNPFCTNFPYYLNIFNHSTAVYKKAA